MDVFYAVIYFLHGKHISMSRFFKSANITQATLRLFCSRKIVMVGAQPVKIQTILHYFSNSRWNKVSGKISLYFENLHTKLMYDSVALRHPGFQQNTNEAKLGFQLSNYFTFYRPQALYSYLSLWKSIFYRSAYQN